MSAHTPGPWEYVLDDDGVTSGVTFVIRMGSHLHGSNGWEPQHRIGYEVSDKQESPKQFAEARANARLIAAAPDLLAALQMVRDADDDCRQENDPNIMPDTARATIDAAIAKAEGR